ncbi:telomere resolvase [Laspinema olomoucense]|uniref:Telomere resolvase n=1 Tax=Laspinema olomoucense D3b TaxID=2953688 RepID=A0ABT2NJY5_9CYAN|nr:telomere resolvase [Laspinema sp. D3b]MCT7981606.1 telomere resolvase [Laspinema sp. D3b]
MTNAKIKQVYVDRLLSYNKTKLNSMKKLELLEFAKNCLIPNAENMTKPVMVQELIELKEDLEEGYNQSSKSSKPAIEVGEEVSKDSTQKEVVTNLKNHPAMNWGLPVFSKTQLKSMKRSNLEDFAEKCLITDVKNKSNDMLVNQLLELKERLKAESKLSKPSKPSKPSKLAIKATEQTTEEDTEEATEVPTEEVSEEVSEEDIELSKCETSDDFQKLLRNIRGMIRSDSEDELIDNLDVEQRKLVALIDSYGYSPQVNQQIVRRTLEGLESKIESWFSNDQDEWDIRYRWFNKLFATPIKTIYHRERQKANDVYYAKKMAVSGNLTEINVKEFYLWCKEILTGDLEKARWEDISIALIFSTGRRMGEIHCSAEFSPIPGKNNWLSFKGQSKGKKENDKFNEVFEIATLLPAENVIKALKFLGEKGKRLPSNLENPDETRKNIKQVNRRFSTALSRQMSVVMAKFNFPKFLYGDNRQDGEVFSYKTCRDLYTIASYQSFPNDEKESRSLTNWSYKVLGHSDLATALIYEKVTVTGLEDLINDINA